MMQTTEIGNRGDRAGATRREGFVTRAHPDVVTIWTFTRQPRKRTMMSVAIVTFAVLAQAAAPGNVPGIPHDPRLAMSDVRGTWLEYEDGKPTGVFFELTGDSKSLEACIMYATLSSEWKVGDRILEVKVQKDGTLAGRRRVSRQKGTAAPSTAWEKVRLTIGPIATGHEGMWAQALSGDGFEAQRGWGCCVERYRLSPAPDLNGEWTAIRGASGVLTIGPAAADFAGYAYEGYSGPDHLQFGQTASGSLEGTVRPALGAAAVPVRLSLTRQADHAARSACGGRVRLRLQAEFDGGPMVLERCARRTDQE